MLCEPSYDSLRYGKFPLLVYNVLTFLLHVECNEPNLIRCFLCTYVSVGVLCANFPLVVYHMLALLQWCVHCGINILTMALPGIRLGDVDRFCV